MLKIEEINPYNQEGDKGKQVEQMFDSIAPAYDFMNTAMSFGLNRHWRNKALKAAIESLVCHGKINILDVATGTGDVAFKLHEMLPASLITGIDLSEGMLDIARKKLKSLPDSSQKKLVFGKGDSLCMPFHDGDFDMVTVAYGVRNFSSLPQGIKEMRRVLKKGGTLCIIELSVPEGRLTAPLYKVYSRHLIPFVGRKVSGDSKAYKYLPESIAACPQREDMAALLHASGFNSVFWKSLTFGAVTYYLAK